MPHSSGGGFHGGGFHGGGFSGHHYGRGGAHSGITISRHHFPGATAWLYYTSRGVPHIVYSTSDITTMPKGAGVFSFFLLGIFAIAPLFMMVATGAKHPEQITLPYNNTIVIEDKANVFTPSDEARLMEVLNDFKNASHVVPAIYTVNNGHLTDDKPTWFFGEDYYASYDLEDYAYSSYFKTCSDERHWVIAYATDSGSPKKNWGFEGVQGDDTDVILFGSITGKFNETLYHSLKGEDSVADSFIKAFNTINPLLLKDSFYIDPEMVAFTVVWELFVGAMLAITIVGQVNAKNYSKAQKIENPESIVMKQCKHCGASYYKGTVERCPKCGRSVVMDDEFDEKF